MQHLELVQADTVEGYCELKILCFNQVTLHPNDATLLMCRLLTVDELAVTKNKCVHFLQLIISHVR